MNLTLKRPLLALLLVGVLAPVASLAACSSDPATSSDAGVVTSSTATATMTTPPVDAAPDAPKPVDAAVDAPNPVDAGTCSNKGASDVKLAFVNSTADASNKATIQLVDTCQGTSAALPYTGTRLRVTPTTGADHYLLVAPTNPADFYKSASLVYNFAAGTRSDTDVTLVAKTGVGSAPASFDATYNAAKVHFLLQLNKVETTCDAGGFVVTVVGHPEAVIQYGSASSSLTPDPALTMSVGDRGTTAFISNVTPGAGLVEFTGTKTGCKLVGLALPSALSPNKHPLIADTVTRLVMNTSL